MGNDIMVALRETMRQNASRASRISSNRRTFDKIVILKEILGYTIDVLNIVMDIQRNRRYRDYEWLD